MGAAEPIPAPASEGDRDPAALLKAEIRAEYGEARTTKKQGHKIMRHKFLEGKKDAHEVPTMDRQSYRAHILAHSLFPNIYNREAVMTERGSS